MKSVKKIEFRICIIRIWLVLFLLLGQKVWAVPLSDISLKLMTRIGIWSIQNIYEKAENREEALRYCDGDSHRRVDYVMENS